MNYQFKTHCPNCFRESQQATCRHCQFNRDDYLKHDAANHHLPLFTKLNKGYVVGRVLGEGGFAVVYAALREADNLSFAIKEYYPEALASRGLDGCTVQPKRKESDRLTIWQRRFEQEGELLRRCQDYPPIAGVVRFADLIKQHNTAYLAMERLHGNSLRLYLTEAKTAQWIISWLNPLLETLAQLHSRAIFHRDISPNNVFLTADNKPVLMDFGLAREGIRDSALKSSTVGAGTEGFIAPEQTMEATSNRVDARTDLYSLGGLVYMALQGEPPPSAAHRVQGAQLKRCKNASGLTEQLDKLAFHCLELDRNKRPENAAMIQKQYALLPQPSISAKTIVPDFTPNESQANKLPQNNATTNEKKELELAKERAIKLGEKKLAEKQRQAEQEAEKSTALKWTTALIYGLSIVGIAIVGIIAAIGFASNSENTPTVDTPSVAVAAAETPVSLEPALQEVNFPNGDKYIGGLKNGKLEGQGTFTSANGDKYIGEYKDGEENGQGTVTFGEKSGFSGDKYTGEFKNGIREGQGTYLFANGSKHEGQWKNNEPDGQGIYTDKIGTYAGEFKNGIREGQGTLTWTNGDRYVGDFKNGNIEGHGTLTDVNGEYKGEFKNGIPNGQGAYTSVKGNVISGIWKDNKFVH